MKTLEYIRNGLSDAIMRHAASSQTPQYVVRDDLGTISDADMIRFYRTTGKIAVWSGGSSHTIYGNERVNWQFRAWHDYMHIASGVCNHAHGPLGCFEPSAEYAVADYQCIGLGDELAKLVQCEVDGQARHYEVYGTFIDDQVAFTLEKMR